MESLLIRSHPTYIGRALGAVFGSLLAPDGLWRHAISLEAAIALTVAAVPEEGEIHPHRADVTELSGGTIRLITPGGVRVDLHPDTQGQITAAIDFGRDSKVAAGQLLAAAHLHGVSGWTGEEWLPTPPPVWPPAEVA